MTTLRKTARQRLNVLLGHAGFQLLRSGERDCIRPYIPFMHTLAEARTAGLSVGDYIDSKYHVLGATKATIDQLATLGLFEQSIQSVCEIGPGSGRYLEKIQQSCAPRSYEIYETDKEWSDWLARTYRVTAHEADGTSLRNTATESVGLVHAHKVFVYLPFIVTFQYFKEMIRVARPGGTMVFDIVSELCMPDSTIEQWIADRTYFRCLLPRDFVIEFFTRKQCSLCSSFLAPMLPGQSEYLVFTKERT
jgi:phospholipid N-methyltransferase